MIARTFILGFVLAACVAVALVVWNAPDKLTQVKVGMTADQVAAIMGHPAHIDASETADQNLSGEVDHYPTSQGDDQVIFVNHTVFKTEFTAK
jgi:SmpA / OmlA family